MNLHMPAAFDTTTVSNRFIDRYMPSASGEYVKIYLYLLRSAQAGREFSLSEAADCFDHTEKDVRRALTYWEKQGLLCLEKDTSGKATGIALLDIPAEREAPAAPAPKLPEIPADAAPPVAATAEPVRRPALSRERLAELQAREDIQQLLFVAETYLARPLRSNEISNLLYFHDALHLSIDLIEYLLEYCISKGHTSSQYMEKVAMGWASDGITTVAQAKQATSPYRKQYFSILKAYGIAGRNPTTPEIDYMVRWLDDYGFPVEIIVEACGRTISQIHQPKFSYTEKILKGWHEAGVSSTDQIARLDKAHEQQRREKRPAARPGRFNDFPQQSYDYSELEKQLLSADHS